MKTNMFIALSAALLCFTGCDIEDDIADDIAESAEIESELEVSPRMIDIGGSCPEGYEWDGSWCVLTGNPGSFPPFGGGSCLAPACKSGCGSRRTTCVAACKGNESCVEVCNDKYTACIEHCCE